MNNDKKELNIAQKNFESLRQNQTLLNDRIQELRQHVETLENAISNVQADIANTKQLMGHLLGRGMGSTGPTEN